MSKKRAVQGHHFVLVAAVLVIAGSLFYFNAPTTAMGGRSGANPIISNITVTQITRTSVVITWNTDVVTSGAVNYGLKASALNQGIGSDGDLTFHTAKISYLNPATKYYFNVAGSSATGFSKSATQSFTTQALSTTDTTPPVAPTVTAIALSGTQIKLTWSGASDASGIKRMPFIETE